MKLQIFIGNQRNGNTKIVMGDLNAKIESNTMGNTDIMERHRLEVMNKNGELFTNFCAVNKNVIGENIFPHKRIDKTIKE